MSRHVWESHQASCCRWLQQLLGGNQGSAKHPALPASTRHVLACLAGAFHRALASGEASGEASDLSTLDVAEADKTDAAPEFAGPHQHGKVSCDVMPHHPISVVDAETAVSQPDPVPCRWRTMWQTRLAFRQTQPVPRPSPHQHSPLETKENRREKSDDPLIFDGIFSVFPRPCRPYGQSLKRIASCMLTSEIS